MYDLLKGLRVVEGAAFIAGPSAGLHMAQMGAEVIRFDAIGGSHAPVECGRQFECHKWSCVTHCMQPGLVDRLGFR